MWHLRTHFSPFYIVTVHPVRRVTACDRTFLWLSFWDTEMKKDFFVSNYHLMVLRVHSIPATMDMGDSFPEWGLLGFPALCSLICSTVSHRKMEKCIFQGCFLSVTALLMAAILSRLGSFLAHTLNIPSIKLVIISSPSLLFLRKATAKKSYFEISDSRDGFFWVFHSIS